MKSWFTRRREDDFYEKKERRLTSFIFQDEQPYNRASTLSIRVL